MVRYKVKPEHVAENEELIRALYEELQSTAPAGLHHASFRLDDGVSFLHLVSLVDDGHDPLLELDAFKRFREHLDERCDEIRVHTGLDEIGSFKLFPR